MSSVTLRAVERDDLEIFFEFQADPVATEMAAFPARERDAHLEHWTQRVLIDPTNLVRTILADGVVAGNILSWIGNDGERMLGYWLGREFWGRGVATEALHLFLPLISERPVFADLAATNLGSRRVLEKNGFTSVWDEPRIASDGVAELLFVLD